MGFAGLVVSPERGTIAAHHHGEVGPSHFHRAGALPRPVRLCPVGGERYPEEARDCPIHHVPLTELMLARLRCEE